MPPAPASSAPFDADTWRRALDGDRDAFETAVAPYHDELLAAAERQIKVHRASGALADAALNPTELVGETLVRAYQHRNGFNSDRLSFRAWLLGVQHRALASVMEQEDRYVGRKALSLGEEVPSNETQDAVEEALYEFRQPFEVVSYADLIAGSEPIDVDFDPRGHEPLTDRERTALADAGLVSDPDGLLSPRRREAVILHDEFDLSVSEVAQIFDSSLRDTAEALNLARATVRQRFGSAALPSDPSDARDSYTGDPVP